MSNRPSYRSICDKDVNYRGLFPIFIIMASGWFPAAYATENNDPFIQKLSAFLGVPPERISVECPQNSYTLQGEGHDAVLRICLNKADNKKRCEVTVHDLVRAPDENHISYDINYADPEPRKLWESITQIHSYPDPGEAWRCPVTDLEVNDGKFRMFNRFDASGISKVSGNNCTEQGNSISARTIFEGWPVPAGQWLKFQMNTKLSYKEDGEIQVNLGDHSTPVVKGPNIFNDQKSPYLKLGIYKPAGFEPGHELSCVQYRDVKITTESR